MAIATHNPSLFELTYEDTKITYAPDAFGGSPRLHYAGPLGQHSFEGDAIRAMPAARGFEISVTLDNVSRFRTYTLTLFVPDVELEDASELSFRTIGIHSTRTSKQSSEPGEGLTSVPLELAGLAKRIQFPPVRAGRRPL